jgi:probable rRNA maturation factor
VKAAIRCDAEITLRFVDEPEGRELNRQFRGKDYATNVLTFPLGDENLVLPDGVELPCMADIVICWPVVEAEASAQKKPLKNHLAHLVIHGCLHAQGHDHENEAEAEIMESMEVALLRRFKISDPYEG